MCDIYACLKHGCSSIALSSIGDLTVYFSSFKQVSQFLQRNSCSLGRLALPPEALCAPSLCLLLITMGTDKTHFHVRVKCLFTTKCVYNFKKF